MKKSANSHKMAADLPADTDNKGITTDKTRVVGNPRQRDSTYCLISPSIIDISLGDVI